MDLNQTKLKLIDFNVACLTSTPGLAMGGVGLKEWSAPETRKHLHYNQKSDAWSLGLLLAYMLVKQDFAQINSYEERRNVALMSTSDPQL